MSPKPTDTALSSDHMHPLEAALCVLQEGIVTLNRQMEVSYINRMAVINLDRILNQTVSIGDRYLDALPETSRVKTEGFIRGAFNNQAGHYIVPPQLSGEEKWTQVEFHPMPDENGTITRVCIRGKDITRQVMLEKELAKEKEGQKNRLIKATLAAQEKQRSEIGRELHDNVNQVLTTIKLYNEICLTEEQTNKKLLLRSVQQINYCIETLRSLSKTLSSPNIAEIDLKESIKELVDEINATLKIEARFMTYGVQEEKVSQDLQTTLYRIAQEQLTNVLKYAAASSVDVLLVGTSSSIALKIEDNGVGFDPRLRRAGVGITNMISRSEALGGIVEILSEPGKGCSLMAEFPLKD